MLEKYNPVFEKISDEPYNLFKEHLKDNKIYQKIRRILKPYGNVNVFDKTNYGEIQQLIERKTDLPYAEKLEMYDYLRHIRNTLKVKLFENEKYENDAEIAQEALLMDEKLKDVKDVLKPLIKNYMEKFEENLKLKEKNKDKVMYGYHYNLMTYNIYSDETRMKWNGYFKVLLSFLSIFLFISKALGTPWVISNYIMSSNDKDNINTLLKKYSFDGPVLWKFMTMGIDTTKFEDLKIDEPPKKTYFELFYKYGCIILLFLFIVIPILQLFMSSSFYLGLSPIWLNFLYQLLFLGGIFGNQAITYNKGSYLIFNIIYFVCVLLILIAITLIMYFAM